MPASAQRRRRFRINRWAWVLAMVPLLLVPLSGLVADADEDEDVARVGQSLYRIYCASCHGDTGKGDGSTAAYLTVKPTDLTKLSRENGGEFPEDRLREIIDGREDVRAHGSREMPLWGLTFQDWNADSGQEEEVRQKIDQLLSYLESIQKK